MDPLPTTEDIQFRSAANYCLPACLWQAENCQIQLTGIPYLVCTAATGSGKTLTFWLPMLYQKGTTFIIVPLKNLGEQMAIAIENHEYRVVIIGPELIIDPCFWALWKQQSFCDGVDRIIIDEFHCIDDWGGCRGEGFHPEFIELR
ncbi:hypothetical protein BS47DRAFT_1436410 [Hydnum rufescens UP504]|uniref:Helicase ATP-binding domain-containing protein n=1 Tax=Hydnum rufescens UP504 TaxID=1448309 RepID=A0A9P6AGD4_9AGAM|nr:hypothetical protein BS47DRAFT_1436410 [Hydnum rufescens UP504]